MRTIRAGLTTLFLGAALLAGCGRTVSVTLPGLPDLSAPGAAPAAVPAGFELLYSPAPHALMRAAAPQPVRRGTYSERYELREGDCGGSDCGAFRARAEIIQDRETTPARLNRDFWAGFSFHNASIGAVTAETALGTVIAHWRLGAEQLSIFRLVQAAPNPRGFAGCADDYCTPGGGAADDVVVELQEIAAAQGWGAAQNHGRICRLFSMAEAQGQWVDIVVNTNFGTDGAGYLRIWVNGDLRCNYLGPLVSGQALTALSADVPGPTHRRGIFNSYTQAWAENFGTAPKPTLIAYFDEYAEGLSRAEVDPALRQAGGAPAVD